jgi:hypothetical protein
VGEGESFSVEPSNLVNVVSLSILIYEDTHLACS